jgi:hypothetical protein
VANYYTTDGERTTPAYLLAAFAASRTREIAFWTSGIFGWSLETNPIDDARSLGLMTFQRHPGTVYLGVGRYLPYKQHVWTRC